VLFFLVVVDPVDAHGDGDHQSVVLAGRHVNAVGVADREPAPRDKGGRPLGGADLIFLADEVADGLELPVAGHVDRVAMLKRGEEHLAYGRDDRAVVLDLHRVPHREQLLVDHRQFGAVDVLQLERLPQAERLRVHAEDLVARRVGDPEVGHDREDPFAHQISHGKEAISLPAATGPG
jgi:hypothetical protein